MRLQTCEPVSMLSRRVLSRVFQNLMVLSADPPPLARTPWLWGLQAMPLTAAVWLLNLQMGVGLWGLQIKSLLSLPPEANRLELKDHFSPQTYCVCPSYLLTTRLERSRMSRIWMVRSREPLARRLSFQATELTRALWPKYSASRQLLVASQISMVPRLVPMAIWEPFWFQLRLEMESGLRSQNLLTRLLLPFQKQRQESRATERTFWEDHSSRLRQKSSCRLGASSTLNGTLLILRYSGSALRFQNLLSMSIPPFLSIWRSFSSCRESLDLSSRPLPPKLNIFELFLSSRTLRYISSRVTFSSRTSCPLRDSSGCSQYREKILPPPTLVCLRRGMKRSVVCRSFSFSSREAPPSMRVSWETSDSKLNSEMVWFHAWSCPRRPCCEHQVEGVLFLPQTGLQACSGHSPLIVSISIQIKIREQKSCYNKRPIRNNKIQSILLPLYCHLHPPQTYRKSTAMLKDLPRAILVPAFASQGSGSRLGQIGSGC